MSATAFPGNWTQFVADDAESNGGYEFTALYDRDANILNFAYTAPAPWRLTVRFIKPNMASPAATQIYWRDTGTSGLAYENPVDSRIEADGYNTATHVIVGQAGTGQFQIKFAGAAATDRFGYNSFTFLAFGPKPPPIGTVFPEPPAFVSPPQDPPGVVLNLVAVPTPGTSDSVDLEWEIEETVSGFRVFRSLSQHGEYAEVLDIPRDPDDSGPVYFAQDSGLAPSTQYWYRVRAVRDGLEGPDSNTDDATTGALTGEIAAPEDVTATALGISSIRVDWTCIIGGRTPFGYYVFEVFGVGNTERVLRAEVLHSGLTGTATIEGLTPATLYQFVVVAYDAIGESKDSEPVVGTTTWSFQGNALSIATPSFSPGANVTILQVANTCQFWSNIDRPIVYRDNAWYPMGLKRPITAPTVGSAGLSGAKMQGTWTAFWMYYGPNGERRSEPSPASTSVTISADDIGLTITPPSSGGSVPIRDLAYTPAGVSFSSAGFYELYLTESGLDNAYLVAQRPVTTVSAYALPVDFTLSSLADLSRRPMEQGRERILPTPCAYAVFQNNRVIATGETTLRPPPEGRITVTAGSKTITVTGWPLTDALYRKELYINGESTGWIVDDVLSTTTATILNPDAAREAAGWDRAAGTFSDFVFAGNPNRVTLSAFYNGEANGGASFSPESFPIARETDFDPDDNDQPQGLIASQATTYLFKRQSVFTIDGGAEPTPQFFNSFSVRRLTRGIGLLAPGSLCRDSQDVPFFLSDQGPMLAYSSGVQAVGATSQAWTLLPRVLNINAAQNAIGAWLPREDALFMFRLNRGSAGDGITGLMWTPRAPGIALITTPEPIVAICIARRDDGATQLLFADAVGNLGEFLADGWYHDYVSTLDSITSTPTSQEIDARVLTGPIRTAISSTPRSVNLAMDMTPDNDDPVVTTLGTVTVEMQNKRLASDMRQFTAATTRTVDLTPYPGPRISVSPIRGQMIQMALIIRAGINQRVAIRELAVEMTLFKASK
jgi:hypothetical protein